MVPMREEMYRALQERYGAELRARLDAGRVAVCGLGGLSSNVAVTLAWAEVGRLYPVDFDRVDLTNPDRQQCTVEQLGQYRTQTPAKTPRRTAPYCEILTDIVQVTEEDLPVLLEKDSIVCETFSRPEAKTMLVFGVLEHFPDKPLITASGMAGLGSANTIHTRRAFDRLYLCDDGTSDMSDILGLVSARVAVCAAHQAHMILQLLAGETES